MSQEEGKNDTIFWVVLIVLLCTYLTTCADGMEKTQDKSMVRI